ncbi:MAG: Asp23/Gls24 family envelope stress response protein [Dehalococcoidia bacterium]|nr:Asp23/Gls24 family envelope stress response protein [Dehalococcoidia bacterium]
MVTEEKGTEELERLRKEVEARGETEISDDVIASIVGVAAKEVQGVAGLGTSSIRRTISERLGNAEERARGVTVEAGKREAVVELTLNVVYGFSIPSIVRQVRDRVSSRLLELTGLEAKEINIHVVGLQFPERMPGRLE